ncbi:uncharacterized protein PHALS_09427 [Plasmopara halstedii]|uniref:Uncharacterized protein n=1 Tax=Plasmopara halstedii TaxID=4781 RepID=A0A0P1A472_PLAHL|nr:uncharacterized protein PHALS_09427 [Plasmopara halstedii]CEG35301.1 hypothetical protein PHALS_09427 [Plasmopara halstedii]|eukprot:XP_024571670.1 hypothetical protein PHALS_09427 [Plasmopara halstedii]
MSSLLLRRSTSSLTIASLRACASLHTSSSVFNSRISSLNGSNSIRPSLISSRTPTFIPHSSLIILQQSSFSSKRKSWQSSNDWKSKLKTGGLILLGTSALIASTSLAFGVVIIGAAGFGMYTLYKRIFRPFQSENNTINSNLDILNDMFNRKRQRQKVQVSNDLESLVHDMPFLVRGFVKTIFSVLGQTMQNSMARAGEVRRRTNEYLQRNERICEEMGNDVSVGGPETWIETTVNGIGSIEAKFPVNGAYGSTHVIMKASIDLEGKLKFTELKYYNRQSGIKIDLLRDSSVNGRRKTVIDAEYVDLNQDSRARW